MKFKLMKSVLVFGALALAISTARAADTPFQDAMQKGRAAFADKQFSQAESFAHQALALAQTPTEKAKALSNLGSFTQAQGKEENARQFWMQALALPEVPTDVQAPIQLLIGGSYFNQEKYDEARAAFRRALQIKGIDTQVRAAAQLLIATSYNNQRQWPQTIAAYNQVASDTSLPTDFRVTAQQAVGEAYFTQEKWDDALAAFRAVAAIQGVSATSVAQAQVSINDVYAQQGHSELVASETLPLVQSFLQKAAAITGKEAQDLAQLRDYYGAMLLLIDRDSTGGLGAQEKLGEVELKSENFAKAREFFDQVLAAPKPEDATGENLDIYHRLRAVAQLNLGAAYTLDGQTDRARQEYQKFLQLPNIDPDLRTAVQKQVDELK